MHPLSRFLVALLLIGGILPSHSAALEEKWNFGAIEGASTAIVSQVDRTDNLLGQTQTLVVEFRQLPHPSPEQVALTLNIDFSALALTGTGTLSALFVNGMNSGLTPSDLTLSNGVLSAVVPFESLGGFSGGDLTILLEFTGPIATAGSIEDVKAKLGY